ncbi:hypothetical protein C0992_008676, partial [Termitomyces sp. T32_za158]
MGSTSFELSKLLEDATQEDIHSLILKDGKDRGELKYDVSYYPVLEAAEGEELPDTSAGIVRLTLHQAKDLDASKSLSGDLNPMAKVFLGDSKKPSHATAAFKHTNSPVWESAHEFLCADKSSSVVTIKVIDDRDFLKDPVIGYMSIKLTDLLSSMGEAGRDWFPLSGCQSGRIRISAEWKPLNMAGSLHGAEQYTPPIGVVKLLLDKATDVKNVEATLGGKSDPYVRVLVNNEVKARTEVINNSLNPVWNEIVYIPVHSSRQSLLLEIMDYQNLTKDRSLGTVDLHLNDLAKPSQDPQYPFESTGPKVTSDRIRLPGNAYKGVLHYCATFIPALALNGVSFDKRDTATKMVNDTISMSSDHSAPVPLTIKSSTRSLSPPTVSTPSPANSSPASSSPAPEADNTSQEAVSKEEQKTKGVDMSVEELLAQQSGIIVFNIVAGNIAKKARLEVLLNEGYWPCFSTTKARSTRAEWDLTGEGFIKEIDFNRVWLRLNAADEGDRDDVVAEWKGDAKAFLRSTL